MNPTLGSAQGWPYVPCRLEVAVHTAAAFWSSHRTWCCSCSPRPRIPTWVGSLCPIWVYSWSEPSSLFLFFFLPPPASHTHPEPLPAPASVTQMMHFFCWLSLSCRLFYSTEQRLISLLSTEKGSQTSLVLLWTQLGALHRGGT